MNVGDCLEVSNTKKLHETVRRQGLLDTFVKKLRERIGGCMS